MYFSSNMSGYFHIIRMALRGQVFFENSILQRLAYTSRGIASISVKENWPFSQSYCGIKNHTHGKGNDNFSIGSKCLLKRINIPDHLWTLEPSSFNTNGAEHNGKGRQGWSLAFALALSIFSTKTGDEEEKKESELIIMIKRGILALKVGHKDLF